MNNLTNDDIKQSIDYQWRMHQANISFLILGIIMLFILLSPIFTLLKYPLESDFSVILWTYLSLTLFYLVLFLPIPLYQIIKAKSLLKNYKSYIKVAVMLDQPSTSFLYKGSIYYSVKIKENDVNNVVDTKPYFSSSLLSKFDMKSYNNIEVIGLYDKEKNKIFIFQ